VTDILATVRAHLLDHFARVGIASEPEVASVTFVGVDPVDVLRFGPDVRSGLRSVYHHVSLGCSRHPMVEPTNFLADPHQGPRAEVMVSLRGPTPTGLSQSIAVLAAAPAVEGLVLVPDALIDLEAPLWQASPFTAMLLGPSDIEDVALSPPDDPVTLLAATPITPTEAAWVRLKGADAMREAWRTDGVDVLDPRRPAAQPK
jgi:hypothetical protein